MVKSSSKFHELVAKKKLENHNSLEDELNENNEHQHVAVQLQNVIPIISTIKEYGVSHESDFSEEDVKIKSQMLQDVMDDMIARKQDLIHNVSLEIMNANQNLLEFL